MTSSITAILKICLADYPRLVFLTDANSTTSKTAVDAVSSKSVDFNKMAGENPIVKAFSLFWMILKFSQKGTILYYGSDEKHNGKIAEPIWSTVLKIGGHSVQEGGPEPPRTILAQLPQRIRIRRPHKTPSYHLDQIKQF